jgi:hypothetical protein
LQDAISFSLLGTLPSSLHFEIESTSGIIRVKNSLIFDSTITYSMTVRAVDSPTVGASPREALAQVRADGLID